MLDWLLLNLKSQRCHPLGVMTCVTSVTGSGTLYLRTFHKDLDRFIFHSLAK